MLKKPLKNSLEVGRIVEISVFGILLIVLFVFVCRLFAPFFTVFLWSILLFIIVDPFYKKITIKVSRKTKKGRFLRTFIAGIFAIFSILLILAPLSLVLSQIYAQAVEVYKNTKGFFTHNKAELEEIYQSVSDFLSRHSDGQIVLSPETIHQSISGFIEEGFKKVFSLSGAIIRDIGVIITGFALMVFCLFFFYLDAPYLADFVKNLIPIKSEYIKTLIEKFKETTRGLVLGYLTVALFQSVIAFLIFSLFSVPGALIFACLTFICVFIPMLGGALVWLPLGISIITKDGILRGILFLALCAVGISFIDNFLRPYFLQNRLKLHPLLIFFAIMGGLLLFGFNGLILGPLTIVLFVTVIEMFFKEYNIKKSEVIMDEEEYYDEKE